MKSFSLLPACFLFFSISVFAQKTAETYQIELTIKPEESWWGGNVVDGRHMPFNRSSSYTVNQYDNLGGNQGQPLFISNQGRYIWSDAALHISFNQGTIQVSSSAPIVVYREGKTLKDAFVRASQTHFPASGKMPDSLFFISPQYNTWIELQYDQNEFDILRYATSIVGEGFPQGVLMIDDNWQTDYGVWQFSSERFTNPQEMVALLHTLGFKVMLWVCPFVSPDSPTYRELTEESLLMFADRGKKWPATVPWWNGQSALIDLTNPKGVAWFVEQLNELVDQYGIDGFKFDGGDPPFYQDIFGYDQVSPNTHAELYAKLGLKFPFNEYRASWKMGGQPLVQRLRDKNHTWEDLQAIIPDMLNLGLIGHPFSCPDMIGGGEVSSFKDTAVLDEELIVRSTQVHALMPMMQFSVAPWRVLNEENLAICRRMAILHQEMGAEIVQLAQSAAVSGEPIVRPMDYVFPHQGFAKTADQFMLGDSILVAPVIEKGKRERKVAFPEGTWKGEDGKSYTGPATVKIDAPLECLPWFRKTE